ncbi:MAG: hypothetical protein IJ190_12205 [Prevotella sp.]|nr:hypothetical protein [Prevotella sp.]
MNKKYLMKGFAALALIAGFSSCVKDVEGVDPVEREAAGKENAELQLGLTIPDGQSWDMATQVSTDVTVNLGLDQEYTVAIYDVNPLYNSNAKFYTMDKVKEGKSLNVSFTLPTATKTVYVATYDSKNRSVVNAVNVENGQIVANIGGATASASRRAAEDASVYPNYVKTLNDYLNPESFVLYGNTFRVTEISLNDMASYTEITDDIITDDTSQGNHTLSDANSNPSQHFPGNGDGKHYRVAAGTEITEVFNINATYGVINDAVIYIEGTVHLNGNTLNGPTLVVAPGGKIILDGNTNMSNAGRVIVMAGGSIEAAEGVTPEFNVNNGAACYNAGTIQYDGQLNVNGSDTYNNGTIIVDVLRNTSGGKFTNFGHITARTNMQAADAYNSTIINGCYMHFTENAGIGTLTLLDNSRLDVDGRAEFNQATQTLYNLSEINAGEMYLNSTTFAGPTTEGSFAIIRTETVWANQGADLGASGNVYFDWNPFGTGALVDHNGSASYNCVTDNGYTTLSYIKNLNLNYTSENTSALIIPEGDCTGMGNNSGGGGGQIIGEPAVYTFAFEDQIYAGDYDLNDVVLKITPHVVRSGSKITAIDYDQLDVKLVASGATFKIHAFIGQRDEDGKPVDGAVALFDGKEIHDAFGKYNAASGATQSMINTGNGKAITAEPVTCTIATPANIKSTDADGNTTLDFSQLDIWIWVNKGTGSQSEAVIAYKDEKKWPYAVMIPNDWAWPTERTCVTEAYAGTEDAETISIASGATSAEYKENSFGAWAATEDAQRTTTMKSWFNYPVSGKTMRNQ